MKKHVDRDGALSPLISWLGLLFWLSVERTHNPLKVMSATGLCVCEIVCILKQLTFWVTCDTLMLTENT